MKSKKRKEKKNEPGVQNWSKHCGRRERWRIRFGCPISTTGRPGRRWIQHHRRCKCTRRANGDRQARAAWSRRRCSSNIPGWERRCDPTSCSAIRRSGVNRCTGRAPRWRRPRTPHWEWQAASSAGSLAVMMECKDHRRHLFWNLNSDQNPWGQFYRSIYLFRYSMI